MENQTLTDIIQETLATVDPETDNPETTETVDTDTEDTDVSIEDLLKDLDDDDEDEEEAPADDAEDGEDEDEDHAPGETYQVKVDGEVIDVTLNELKAGYQRQADYTRKSQALAAEREELEQASQEFSDTLQSLDQLNQAWDEDPIEVLSHFTSSTGSPTQTVALLIQRLAVANQLEPEFLEVFGITKEVREAWGKETEVSTLRRKVSASEKEQAQKQAEAEYEAEVQRAIAEYESQIDEIVAAEGLELTKKQREVFRTKLAGYAAENELTNLKAAYKALKYEESQKRKEVAKRTAERAKQKKNASVVGRSGAGSAGAAPVSDNTDLSSVIRATMAEQGLA